MGTVTVLKHINKDLANIIIDFIMIHIKTLLCFSLLLLIFLQSGQVSAAAKETATAKTLPAGGKDGIQYAEPEPEGEPQGGEPEPESGSTMLTQSLLSYGLVVTVGTILGWGLV